MMRLKLICVLALCAVSLTAQGTASLEKRLQAAQTALESRRAQLTRIYERVEDAVGSGRTALCETVRGAMDQALQNARTASAGGRQKIAAEFRKGLQALEAAGDSAAVVLLPWIQTRTQELLSAAADAGVFLKLSAQEVTDQVLEPLLRAGRAFHQTWNEDLAARLPEAEQLRRATAEVSAATLALEAIKDPSAAFRHGAPAGFARIPAGSYMVLCSAGFSGQGVRKKDRSISLDHDVFLGIHEVTCADYLAWLLKLSEADRRRHAPQDAAGKPLWEPEPGSGILAVPPGTERFPVCGITLESALAYAQAQGARLPSEEEWCAAAAGPKKLLFPWGARYEAGRCNDRDAGSAAPVAVGSFPSGAGAFGHMDLAGNAAEWTMTYESGKLVDPAALAQENVAVRGGSFRHGSNDVSAGWVWLKRAIGDRDAETGFRLLIDPAAKPR